MGCFSVSCSLSGITIHSGDPCYFIPLMPEKYSNGEMPDRAKYIVSNEGPYAYYVPAFLPIEGTYDEYGSLENPVINSNTKLIEKVLKTDISNFLRNSWDFTVPQKQFKSSEEIEKDKEYLAKTGKDRSLYKYINVPISGMFVHKFAYDKAYEHTMNDEYSLYNSHHINEYKLKQLKLNKPTIDKKEQRYNQIYRQRGVKTHVIQSDGSYSHVSKVTKDGYKPLESTYCMEDMKRVWEKATGKNLEIPEHFKTTHFANEDIDAAQKFYKKTAEINKKNRAIKKELKAETDEDKIKALKLEIRINDMLHEWKGEALTLLIRDPCTELYEKLIGKNDKTTRKLICELNSLRSFMYSNNQMFAPALSGPQCGDTKAEISLRKSIEVYHEERAEKEKEWEQY